MLALCAMHLVSFPVEAFQFSFKVVFSFSFSSPLPFILFFSLLFQLSIYEAIRRNFRSVDVHFHFQLRKPAFFFFHFHIIFFWFYVCYAYSSLFSLLLFPSLFHHFLPIYSSRLIDSSICANSFVVHMDTMCRFLGWRHQTEQKVA